MRAYMYVHVLVYMYMYDIFDHICLPRNRQMQELLQRLGDMSTKRTNRINVQEWKSMSENTHIANEAETNNTRFSFHHSQRSFERYSIGVPIISE